MLLYMAIVIMTVSSVAAEAEVGRLECLRRESRNFCRLASDDQEHWFLSDYDYVYIYKDMPELDEEAMQRIPFVDKIQAEQFEYGQITALYTSGRHLLYVDARGTDYILWIKYDGEGLARFDRHFRVEYLYREPCPLLKRLQDFCDPAEVSVNDNTGAITVTGYPEALFGAASPVQLRWENGIASRQKCELVLLEVQC